MDNFFSNNIDQSCISNNNGGSGTTRGGQRSNSTTQHAWDIWQLGSSSTSSQSHQLIQWTNNNTTNISLYGQDPTINTQTFTGYPTITTSTTTDHHLMCLNLKLGNTKRHAFENQPLGFVMNKRRKPYFSPGSDVGVLLGPSTTIPVALVPRCQVEGCQVALVNAKAYHRRHKVCEIHAKAPNVLLLGFEQRFCQQCSRFHSLSEFDESKRSCRRRLAGHNKRRRKSSQEHFANTRNSSQENKPILTGNFRDLPINEGRALSLLSSKNDSWISTCNLPGRCSATLDELISESRATSLARPHSIDKDCYRHQHHLMDNPTIQSKTSIHNLNQTVSESHDWERINSNVAGYLTLDFMHVRNSEFGFLSGQEQPKEEREVESQKHWNSFAGAHVA